MIHDPSDDHEVLDGDEPVFPPAFTRALAGLRSPVGASSRSKNGLREAAELHFGRLRWARRQRAGVLASAAAVLLIVTAVWAPWSGPASEPAPQQRADDANRDGRVDVLDAHQIARAGAPAPEVDGLMRRIVALEGRSRPR